MLDRLLGKTSETMERLADPPYLEGDEVNKVVSEHAAENTFPRSSSPSSPTSPAPASGEYASRILLDLDSLTLCEHFKLDVPPYATAEIANGILADAMLEGPH
jgi:hypothetical protein